MDAHAQAAGEAVAAAPATLVESAVARGLRAASYLLATRIAPSGPALDLDGAAEAGLIADGRALTVVAATEEAAAVLRQQLGQAADVVVADGLRELRPLAVVVATRPGELLRQLVGALGEDGVLVVPLVDAAGTAALRDAFAHVEEVPVELTLATRVGEATGEVPFVVEAALDVAGEATDRDLLAVASQRPIAALAPFVLDAGAANAQQLRAGAARARGELELLRDELAQASGAARELEQARERLLAAERIVAAVPQLERDLARCSREAREAIAAQADAEEQLARTRRANAAMQASLSWRLTRPLRATKQLGRD